MRNKSRSCKQLVNFVQTVETLLAIIEFIVIHNTEDIFNHPIDQTVDVVHTESKSFLVIQSDLNIEFHQQLNQEPTYTNS